MHADANSSSLHWLQEVRCDQFTKFSNFGPQMQSKYNNFRLFDLLGDEVMRWLLNSLLQA
jgi:hypothetical protein